MMNKRTRQEKNYPDNDKKENFALTDSDPRNIFNPTLQFR